MSTTPSKKPKTAPAPPAPTGVAIPLEAAGLLIEAWVRAQGFPRSQGTVHGRSATYHVRLTDEGTIRLTVEPPSFAEAERLERKRRAEIDLAQALTDRRAAAHTVQGLEGLAAGRKADPETLDGYADAKALARDAKRREQDAREILEQCAADAPKPAAVIELPSTLEGLKVIAEGI